jgi:hypothetical protein
MPIETKEEKKALPVIILVGAGVAGLAAYLLRRKQPDKAILYGLVTDAETNAGIPNVQVNCGGYTGKTDARGDYRIINIPPGTYPVTFTAAGYESLTV